MEVGFLTKHQIYVNPDNEENKPVTSRVSVPGSLHWPLMLRLAQRIDHYAQSPPDCNKCITIRDAHNV